MERFTLRPARFTVSHERSTAGVAPACGRAPAGRRASCTTLTLSQCALGGVACAKPPLPTYIRHGSTSPLPASPVQVWVKPSAEQSFLYGNHVLKAGLGRITEDTPQNQGVLILSMADVPLGFGVTAKSTAECRKLDPQAIVALHQADVGEYLRDEGALAG